MTDPTTITGVSILGSVFLATPDLMTIVPEPQMKGGRLPQGISLPAILLRTVTSIEVQRLKRGTVKRMIDRTAVTVRTASYREQQQLIAMVRSIGGNRTGDIGGAWRVAIRTAGAGPDLDGPGDSFEQTTDFRISYEIPA
jgi:hypothetical protein